MAGYVPDEFRASLVEALAGRTDLLATTVYLGLATRVPDNPLESTLVLIDEVTTDGYARAEIPPFDPASTVRPVQITVATAFSFAPLEADMELPANYAFVTEAADGTEAPIRYLFELPVPILGRAGEPITVPASALVLE